MQTLRKRNTYTPTDAPQVRSNGVFSEFYINRIEFYKDKCFKYGILSLLILLDVFVEEENYEECAFIINAIREMNTDYKLNLSTEINKETISDVIKEIKNITGIDKTDIDLLFKYSLYAEEIYSSRY